MSIKRTPPSTATAAGCDDDDGDGGGGGRQFISIAKHHHHHQRHHLPNHRPYRRIFAAAIFLFHIVIIIIIMMLLLIKCVMANVTPVAAAAGNEDVLLPTAVVAVAPLKSAKSSSLSMVPNSTISSSSSSSSSSSLSPLYIDHHRGGVWWNRPPPTSPTTVQSFITAGLGDGNKKWNHHHRRRDTNTSTNAPAVEAFRWTKSKRESIRSVYVNSNPPPSSPFWHRVASSSPPVRRRLRRLTRQFQASSSSSSSFSSSSVSGLSHLSAAASIPVAAPANRHKILMNPAGPPGLVVGLMPPPVPVDSKCNFEIYRSGCFDENGSVCNNEGRCVCRPGYTIRTGNIYCLRPSFIGEACYTTEQCEHKVPHSGCFNYREEYREENPSAFFGPSQSQWPMGECRCRVGHRFDERGNVCIRSIIGSWCSNLWDCEMAAEDVTGNGGGGSHSHAINRNHSGGHHTTNAGPQSHQQQRSKFLICENNTCQCGQFFHYNQTAEECQYEETYGQTCTRPVITETTTTSSSGSSIISTVRPNREKQSSAGKRSTMARFRTVGAGLPSPSLSQYRGWPMAKRSGRSNDRDECNYPAVCSANKTCACADGYEYQPRAIPACQRPMAGGIGGTGIGGGAHYTHYYHSGSSGVIRSMKDANNNGLAGYYEGTSNVANFFEYVLYFLVPGLIIIFIFKPCFRRIGEWRNHIHQYQSDSDFYLAGPPTANGRPVITEMNVLGQPASAAGVVASSAQCSGPGTTGAGTDKSAAGSVVATTTLGGGGGGPTAGVPGGADVCTDFTNAHFAFAAPHLVCHNAYLFHDAGDPCYATPLAYGCHAQTSPLMTNHHHHHHHQQQQQQQQAMALVREKLQTIEESEQSEDGTGGNTTAGITGCSMGQPSCCSAMECSCEPSPPPKTEVSAEPTTTTTTVVEDSQQQQPSTVTTSNMDHTS